MEHDDRRAEAEDLVVGLLGRDPAEAEQELESLCARRPELEEALRSLYSNACRGQRALDFAGVWGAQATQLLARLAEPRRSSERYEIRGEIGRGGMGVVQEVWDGNLQRFLAMKVARSRPDPLDPTRAQRAVGRFLEEARITGQLQHPGIVPVHELGVDAEGRPFFTMTQVSGREFTEVIRAVRSGADGWNLPRALGVLVRVCQTVGYAHSRGVLHRDLKPANIMVGAFGETYVMDWGLARADGSSDAHDIRLRPQTAPRAEPRAGRVRAPSSGSPLITMDGDVVGTPAYMSPEQAAGRVDELSPRSDVYSIGAMLYHLLTGRAPFPRARGSSRAPHAVLAQVLGGPPRPVLEVEPGTPAELAEICSKAMSRDPQARYATALELASDLRAYLENRPVSAHEASPAYSLRLAVRRNRAVFATAAVALLGAISWGVVYVVQVRAAFRRERHQFELATAAQRQTQRLSDSAQAQLLLGRLDQLFPGKPGAQAQLSGWLAQADPVLSRAPIYRERAEAREDEALMSLCARLERLQSAREVVARRLDTVESLRQSTVVERRDAWQRARAEIETLPVYDRLDLPPQVGLVPLHRDPRSGLWEFWVALSGEEPALDADGEIELRPETAVVLVLIPGGTVRSAYDGREVGVEPFFIGKYEVTQAQWERQMGTSYLPYAALLAPEESCGPLNPVDSVDWNDSHEFAQRVGCDLPDEYQWELACRGGTTSRFWWGDDPAGAQGRENVLERDGLPLMLAASYGDWHDGYAIHAPVGSFEPNPYGLYDMGGNVAEWCSNWWPDREVPDPRLGRKALRGGGWAFPPEVAESGQWQADNPRGLNQARGLRLARPIRPGEAEPGAISAGGTPR